MQVRSYKPFVAIQIFLLIEDIFMNAFSDLLRLQNVVLLVLYILQDVFIIFAVIVVVLQFFNTYIFQAGLVSVLINRFKVTLIVIFFYFALNVGLHIWTMTLRWPDVNAFVWTPGLRALYVIQRTVSCFYFFWYYRTMLKLGDPRFYQDSEWIRREFEKRR